jgi:hypothetical protein
VILTKKTRISIDQSKIESALLILELKLDELTIIIDRIMAGMLKLAVMVILSLTALIFFVAALVRIKNERSRIPQLLFAYFKNLKSLLF